MDKLRRIWQIIKGNDVQYEDQSHEDNNDRVTTKDLLRFMEKQSESNSQLISAVLQSNISQSETLKNYIDLFKPREMKSTTLEEREAMKEKVKVRDSEWEGLDAGDFNKMIGGDIPPDPSEW